METSPPIMNQIINAEGDLNALQVARVDNLNCPILVLQQSTASAPPTASASSTGDEPENDVLKCTRQMTLDVLKDVKSSIPLDDIAFAYDNLPTHIMEEVKKENPQAKNEDLVCRLTERWIERGKEKATIGKFAEALMDIGKPELIEKIRCYAEPPLPPPLPRQALQSSAHLLTLINQRQ